MRTNIVLDAKLTEEAFALTGLQTKRELVDLALRELIRHRKAQQQSNLQHAFTQLHQLCDQEEPFPTPSRENRPNSFANDL